MKVKRFTVNPFAENTYVCHSGREAVIVDPGCSNEAERGAVLSYIEENELELRLLLLTHAHVDHVIDCAFFAGRFDLEVWMHEADRALLEAAPRQAELYGITMDPPPVPARWIDESTVVAVGEAEWEVRHCPGHSPGSVVFYDPDNEFVLGGDVLFRGSIGRTDLYRGSMPELLRSIHTKLLTLDEATIVYPGHGEPTTIDHEQKLNPFLT